MQLKVVPICKMMSDREVLELISELENIEDVPETFFNEWVELKREWKEFIDQYILKN